MSPSEEIKLPRDGSEQIAPARKTHAKSRFSHTGLLSWLNRNDLFFPQENLIGDSLSHHLGTLIALSQQLRQLSAL